jgi:hypothetical protein
MTRRLIRGAATLLIVGCASMLASCGSTPTLDDPAVTGRALVTEFLTLLSTEEAPGLEDFLADGFQLQRADGTGATKAEYVEKHALVESFEIGDDLVAVQDGDLLTVRWTVVTEESVGGAALGGDEAPRISVFVYEDGDWRMVAHANFNLPA